MFFAAQSCPPDEPEEAEENTAAERVREFGRAFLDGLDKELKEAEREGLEQILAIVEDVGKKAVQAVRKYWNEHQEKKYSGKYAFSELLVCGECGSPYRRQTYMPRGEKYYVWRCLNRMENGRRICKDSPTFTEHDLQMALIAAINEMFSQQRAKDVVRDSVAAALAAKAPKLSLPAVEGQLRAVQERQMELMRLAYDAGAENTAFDTEIRKIYEAKAQLLMLKSELEQTGQDTSEYDDRMERIGEALKHWTFCLFCGIIFI